MYGNVDACADSVDQARLSAHEREPGFEAIAKQALTEKLEDQLTCAVCLDTFSDPKLLPCFHVFCKDYLERLVVKDRLASCPGSRGGGERESLGTRLKTDRTTLPVLPHLQKIRRPSPSYWCVRRPVSIPHPPQSPL